MHDMHIQSKARSRTRLAACWAGFALACAAAAPATAELSASLGIEYFRWKEDTTPAVKETGPMLALGLAYTQDKDDGLLFAYRGRAYFGDVDYEGAFLFSGAPASGTTRYSGISNEGQVRWRGPVPGRPEYYVDYVMALGWETWRRRLSSIQKEDYDVAFVRIGAELALRNGERWMVGGGVKLPVYVREDAHLTDIGFDRNPALKPGRAASLYANVGYNIDEKLRVSAYYDGYEFRDSPAVDVSPFAVYQPASTMSVIGLKLEYRLK